MTSSIIAHETVDSKGGSVFQPGWVDFKGIPLDLRDRPQWVVWRNGKPKAGGGFKKVPCIPTTGRSAESNNPATWGTFDQARDAYIQRGYDGIGFVMSPDDPYLALDFDHCYDPSTGKITKPDVAGFIALFGSYTEVSPSGTGLHVVIRAASPENRKEPGYEVIAANTLITLTGQQLHGTPATIEARQEVFNQWYAEQFPSRPTPTRQDAPLPTVTDEAIIRRVTGSKKGQLLWSGDTTGNHSDRSAADQALANLITRYTHDREQIERIARQSDLVRPKWDEPRGKSTYIGETIEKALETTHPRRNRKAYHPVTYRYDWQDRVEAPGWREGYLRDVAMEAKQAVEAHIKARSESLLAIALPPGVGKTRVVSELGATYDIAWVAIRRDLYQEISQSAVYRFIERCQDDNCPDAERMNRVSRKGKTPMKLHRQHDGGLGCGFYLQFQKEGSAFYRAEHLPTSYVGEHEAVIVDELEVSRWLKKTDFDDNYIALARRADQWQAPYFDPVRHLLRTLYEVLLSARGELHGRALFAALHTESGGKLREWILAASMIEQAMEERPQVQGEDDIAELEREGQVIVPFIVRWLLEDLPKWDRGGDWNSRAHVYIDEGKPHLRILTPLRPSVGVLVLLDGTANDEVLSRIVGRPVHPMRQKITPPPNTRHFAVRTRKPDGRVKGYSKRSLVGKDRMGATERQRVADEQARTVRAIKYVIKRGGVTGSKAIISYKGCVDALGEALGIPPERRGHFGNIRGSNAFNDCDVLIVVGTPIPTLGEIVWWARALYADDPEPIHTTQVDRRYTDPRLAGLLDYLVNSELTQAAHRNRPIRKDGRTVMSFTSGEIDFLPVTDEITELSYLPTQARLDQKAEIDQARQEQLDRAYEVILARGDKMSVKVLRTEAGVKTKAAGDYLRGRRDEAERFPIPQ